jgi:hypothetical protein
MSARVLGELSVSLGGSGELSALPGIGLVTFDASGTPLAPETVTFINQSSGAPVESSLNSSLGLPPAATAQVTDGPIGVDAGPGTSPTQPGEATSKTLTSNLPPQIESELEAAIFGFGLQ